MISMESKCWYCGTVKFKRLEASTRVFGPIKRLQEHLVHTKRCDFPASNRPRYQTWRTIAIHSLHLVVLYIGTSADARQHEAACIKALQPTTQTEIGQAQTSIDAKPRLWKHKRRTLTRRQELAVNVEARIKSDPRKDQTHQVTGMTFIELCVQIYRSRQ